MFSLVSLTPLCACYSVACFAAELEAWSAAILAHCELCCVYVTVSPTLEHCVAAAALRSTLISRSAANRTSAHTHTHTTLLHYTAHRTSTTNSRQQQGRTSKTRIEPISHLPPSHAHYTHPLTPTHNRGQHKLTSASIPSSSFPLTLLVTHSAILSPPVRSHGFFNASSTLVVCDWFPLPLSLASVPSSSRLACFVFRLPSFFLFAS